MDKIYAPWRQKYIIPDSNKQTSDTCPFCNAVSNPDDMAHFVLKRYERSTVMLNLYPYNAGHLLVIPNNHYKDLQQLSTDERNELMLTLSKSIAALQKTIKPEGINVGANLGSAAGASITEHLHVHVLPRWAGDTNFMPLLAGTKTVSFDLKEIYQQIKAGF